MPRVTPYRIVLADDHVMFRHGLKRIIEEKADLEVVGEAGDGLELLDLLNKLMLNQLTPHMVIVDISMPNLQGIEATRQIKLNYPDTKVMILSMHKNQEYLNHSFKAGAEGYILKEDADTDLFSAIETIRQGKVYISPLLHRKAENEFF